jgi:hypothetical protein
VTSLAALRGDERLLDAWRREGFEGAVHSVFDRVVNLAGADGRLVSLAARSLDDAPNTLRIDTDRFDRRALRVGAAAIARDAILHVDEPRLAVRLERAARWRARLPDYPADDARLRRNLTMLCDRLGADAPGLLEAPSRAMADALRRGDVDGVRAHGRAMLGLGPGLTPSGDDFLVGLFAVLNVASSPCHLLRAASDGIVADAETRTHAISIAALREAAHGRVRESIETLLREVLRGPPASMLAALERVLAIGATSGRDIAAGIVCGLRANAVGRAARGRSVAASTAAGGGTSGRPGVSREAP